MIDFTICMTAKFHHPKDQNGKKLVCIAFFCFFGWDGVHFFYLFFSKIFFSVYNYCCYYPFVNMQGGGGKGRYFVCWCLSISPHTIFPLFHFIYFDISWIYCVMHSILHENMTMYFSYLFHDLYSNLEIYLLFETIQWYLMCLAFYLVTLALLRKRAEHNNKELSSLEEISLHQENIERYLI